MRNTFIQKVGSKSIQQGRFPSFGYIYLFLLMFIQFFGSGVRVARTLLMNEELQFDENVTLMVIHSKSCLVDFMMCVGLVISKLYCGTYVSVILQKVCESFITFPLCIIATTGFLRLDYRKMIYLFGQLVGVLTSFATACLPYFVADQFNTINYMVFTKMQSVVNLTCTALGIFTIPHVIQYFECFQTKTCYTLVWVTDWAVGVVTLLVFLALYRFVRNRKQKESAIMMFIKLIYDGRKRKRMAKENRNLRIMPLFDYSKMYTPEFRKDAKKVWSMWSFYFPLAGYWALHSQLMTSWVLQAKQLNGDFFQWSNILPNEICGVVPLFGLLIKMASKNFFQGFHYPLRAVVFSQMLMAVAFLLAAVLEMQVMKYEKNALHIGWTLPQLLLFTVSDASLLLSYREFVGQEIPLGMRSVTQTLFIMSRSFGNAIVVFLNLLEFATGFPNRMAQFIIYGIMLNLFLIIFAVMNRRFERVLDDDRASQLGIGRITDVDSVRLYGASRD